MPHPYLPRPNPDARAHTPPRRRPLPHGPRPRIQHAEPEPPGAAATPDTMAQAALTRRDPAIPWPAPTLGPVPGHAAAYQPVLLVPATFVAWHAQARAQGFDAPQIALYAAVMTAAPLPAVWQPPTPPEPRPPAPPRELRAYAQPQPNALLRARVEFYSPAALQALFTEAQAWARDRIARAHRLPHSAPLARAVVALAYDPLGTPGPETWQRLHDAFASAKRLAQHTPTGAAQPGRRDRPATARTPDMSRPRRFDEHDNALHWQRLVEELGAWLRQVVHDRTELGPLANEDELQRAAQRLWGVRSGPRATWLRAMGVTASMQTAHDLEATLQYYLLLAHDARQLRDRSLTVRPIQAALLRQQATQRLPLDIRRMRLQATSRANNFLASPAGIALFGCRQETDLSVRLTLAAGRGALQPPHEAFIDFVDDALVVRRHNSRRLYVWPPYANLTPTSLTAKELGQNLTCGITLDRLHVDAGDDDRIAQPVIVRTTDHIAHVFAYEALMRAWMPRRVNPMTTLRILPSQMMRCAP